MMDLARNVSKCYKRPNTKPVSKDLLDTIHDHNTERDLSLIKKELDMFGFLFLCYTTLFRSNRVSMQDLENNLTAII